MGARPSLTKNRRSRVTKEEILAMKPGIELNVKAAEEIMGHAVVMDKTFGWLERLINPEDGSSIWSPPQPYSEDISVADLVVDRMHELGFDDAGCWADLGGGKYAKAEAICKAALLAILERRRIERVSNEILEQALGDEQGQRG